MKTRIVYPKYWKDENYVKTSLEAKVLFSYLTTCDSLSLTRYHRISDRQIMFDTGLNVNQLITGKEELSNLKWCFFYKEWVYHNHDAAYVSYEGRDRVLYSKLAELDLVPSEIIEFFNPLITRYEPVLNYKSETINNKSEIRNSEGYKKFQENRNKLFRNKKT